MNYITSRAVNLTKYLIKQGIDPHDAVMVAISKYIHNPKLDIKKMIAKVKKEIKQDLYFEEEDL